MNVQRILRATSTIAEYMRENPGQSIRDIIEAYEEPLTHARLTEEEADEVYAGVMRELLYSDQRDHAEVEDPAVVLNPDPELHVDWYDDWSDANQHACYYWPHLEQFVASELRSKLGDAAAGRIIRSMDLATNSIVRLLENPSRPEFDTKGLVVGFVQSGKTANFTALIAKALDAGYKLVVVLTGTHDILRKQTQQRLDRELTGEVEVEDLTHVDLPASEHRRFLRLTSRDQDFKAGGLSSLETTALYRNPVLCVMKKNPAVMRRFRDWVRRAPDAVRQRVPFLLIDDEADLASVDTNANRPGADPTATNATIREILALFPRSAYVGYTATPFANVLINSGTRDAALRADLYPRNFVVSLPRPEGYFGAEQVFQRPLPNPFVRLVPDSEVAVVRPRGRRQAVLLGIPEYLNRALLSFVLAGSARLKRGQVDKPMTMLVHTSQSQAAHRRLKELLDDAVAGLKSRIADSFERGNLLAELRNRWEEDFMPTSAALQQEFGNPVHEFADIEPYIHEFLDELQLFELNSNSFDDLDYTATPNIKALAVGGNKLSRGLTLEGLMVSYYLRRSTEYDTLLQMGRWFGYRHGFEDLTRVFTSTELASWFWDLATVEDELRDAIKRYEDEGLTPEQMAVRIRAHRTMRVTSPRKFGAGTTVQGTFSGGLVQTIWFPLDEPGILDHNLRVTADFVRGLAQYGRSQEDPGWLARGVPVRTILEYLRAYRFVPRRDQGGPSLDAVELIEYIERQMASGELLNWNVGVKTQAGGRAQAPPAIEVGDLANIIPVSRSRLRNTAYKVGVISDPTDLVADLQLGQTKEDRRSPLLVVYPIWKDSVPLRSGDKLVPLFDGLREKRTVIGVVIDFPRSASEPYDYVAQII
jgi:hypothetical protein